MWKPKFKPEHNLDVFPFIFVSMALPLMRWFMRVYIQKRPDAGPSILPDRDDQILSGFELRKTRFVVKQ